VTALDLERTFVESVVRFLIALSGGQRVMTLLSQQTPLLPQRGPVNLQSVQPN